MVIGQNLRVAMAQMTSIDRSDENLNTIFAMIEEAAKQEARLVVFPENSVFMRLQPGSQLQVFDPVSESGRKIASLAKQHNIHILLTTPCSKDSKKAVNATIYWRPGSQGEVVYSKIHLFDVEVDGAPPVRESDYFHPGDVPSVLEIEGWRFGLSICYDLRFAELYANYQGKVDAILIPSAFLVPTGEAHWHVLLRARAIESQSYVLAPAQCGEHHSHNNVVRKTFGHSLAVDPWGRVLVDNDQGPGIKIVELAAEKLAWVRKQIPMAAHRVLSFEAVKKQGRK